MKIKLNHSRTLDIYRRVGERSVEIAATTPTHKQRKFARNLIVMCKENEIDPSPGHRMKTRVDYAMAIDTLLSRLQRAGIDVRGNGKSAVYAMSIKADRYGGYKHTARIVVEDECKSALVQKFEKIMAVGKS